MPRPRQPRHCERICPPDGAQVTSGGAEQNELACAEYIRGLVDGIVIAQNELIRTHVLYKGLERLGMGHTVEVLRSVEPVQLEVFLGSSSAPCGRQPAVTAATEAYLACRLVLSHITDKAMQQLLRTARNLLPSLPVADLTVLIIAVERISSINRLLHRHFVPVLHVKRKLGPIRLAERERLVVEMETVVILRRVPFVGVVIHSAEMDPGREASDTVPCISIQ